MPTYDYVCDACGHEMELFQRITEGPKKKCPACGKNKLRRLIGTGGAVLFKGSGFYETDYRSKAYSEAAKKEKSASTETKKDTKDAAKPAKADKPISNAEASQIVNRAKENTAKRDKKAGS